MVATTADDGEVSLHLLPGFGLETHHGIICRARALLGHKGLELAVATVIASLLNLAQQDGGWNPVRARSCDAFEQVLLERFQLGRTGCSGRIAHRFGLTQIASDSVARTRHASCNLSDGKTLTGHDSDLHCLFLGQHVRRSQSRHLHPGGSVLLRQVGQFLIGGDTADSPSRAA